MKKSFISIALFVVMAVGGTLVVLRNANTGQDEQLQTQIQSEDGCITDAECVLVQDGWCKTVHAVKKDKEAEWRQQNIQQAESARQNQQTCELMPPEYMRIENFKAVCEQSRCVAERVDNSIGIQDMTAVE